MTFRVAPFASVALLGVALAAVGCSSSTSAPSGAGPAADAGPAPGTEADSGTPAAPDSGTPGAPQCAAPPSKSTCGENAWVRGMAHFDPALLKAGSKPILRVVLRHSFIVVKGEETVGGRLHAYANVPVTDPSKGEVPFAIDMCDLGTSMWSEENGAFHLVLMLDETGANDLDKATSNEDAIVIGTAGKGELVKMVDVDVSCKGASACLDVKVDCTDGASCLTFQPVKSCAKKLPGCNSASAFCK